ncbi:hypothetical protein VSR34_02880 [Paraburkholderia sp. JHI2823]|uniref:hypothetical protein n=1 Tax=Paraburkholderia sp. JHI2823 TaxID=3112960 RepID=UPI00317A5532
MESLNDETQNSANAPGENARGSTEQTLALLALLEHGRRQIEAGNFTPAGEVFAELEEMDRQAGII